MGRFIENPPAFRIMGCQGIVILVEKRVAHLTGDALTLYTRFRQNNVSLSGNAVDSQVESSSRMPLARNI